VNSKEIYKQKQVKT